MNQRISWHEYFMQFAILASKRSTCLSRQVGAVAVKNKRILATGYNGQISGTKHCITCLRKNAGSGNALDRCKAIHAEANVVAQAAQYGTSLRDASIYVMLKPCNMCFKLLANTLIKEIIYKQDYPDPIVDELICDAGYSKSFLNIITSCINDTLPISNRLQESYYYIIHR